MAGWRFGWFIITALCMASTLEVQGQRLFFREDWKEIEAALPVTQEHVANPDLVLTLYGPAKDAIKKSNHPQIPNDPYYIWSGECLDGTWAVGLRHRKHGVDLTGNAKIIIRSRQTGFRQLRVILKLHDGTWLISEDAAGRTDDWTEKEFRIGDQKWRILDINTVTERNASEDPDLSNVSEVGFTDLMTGGGTPASSRLDWIEVWGTPVNSN